MYVKPDVTFHFRFRHRFASRTFFPLPPPPPLTLLSLHFFLRPISPSEPDAARRSLPQTLLQRDGFNWEKKEKRFAPAHCTGKKIAYIYSLQVRAFEEIVSAKRSVVIIITKS